MRSLPFVVAALLFTTSAMAEDCPPGSVWKSEDGFSWCEPSLCLTDVQCKSTEVCRPIALCMEVGTLNANAKADAGKRLVVTARCGPDKTCPQNQTCSELSRCIDRTVADRIGLMAAPASSSVVGAPPAKTSSCGCDVVGAPASNWLVGLLPLGIILRARAKRRALRRRAQ